MMASNRTKCLPKLFVNDMTVQQFCGIFSAHYCWPGESNGHSVCQAKCWSQVMCENPERFAAKLWPKVVDKLPLITRDQKSVQQINELMFGLILKELDLLTFSQMQYFESVLDLFNDEITIGLKCWLKVCYQFNWRLIYAKQVVSHRNKHLRQVIEAIVEEIETNEKEKWFTFNEISYFYSLIECICIQLLANNIISKSSTDNHFLVETKSRISSKLCQLNYDPFVRQLTAFNAITQELVGFSLKLIGSESLCDDIIESQLKQIEVLFTDGSQELTISSQIPVDITDRLSEDISIANDNQKSLEIVNKEYHSIWPNLSIPVLKSLEIFFKSIESQTNQLLSSKRFQCLSYILNDKYNPNYRKMIEILINFSDFETFGSFLLLLNAVDINNYDLTLKLAKRVVHISSDPKTKNFLTALLIKCLKYSEAIDLKSRLNELKINKICEPTTDSIKTLFNQITKDDFDSSLFEDLTHELLIGVYLNPFPVYNLILDLALHHNRAQAGLVAKLLCDQLYCLSKFKFKAEDTETFLMKFIIHLLVEKPSIKLVEDMTHLIEEIIKCQSVEGQEPVLALDELFYYLIKYQTLMKPDIVWLKLRLIKNLIELSGDQTWDSVNLHPVPALAFLLQFIEYFWQNPNRKQLVIEILDLILDKKLTRNLTEEELTLLEQMLVKQYTSTPGKASTYRIYLAYCEKRFPKPINEVINITKNIYHDQILCYATITPDFMWICHIYPAYQIFTDQIKTAVNYILPALTTQEFYKLFKFLQMYYYNSTVIRQLRTAISAIDRNIDKMPMIKGLMDIVTNEVLIPTRNETFERPLSHEDFEYIKMDLSVLFRSLAGLEYQMLPKDLITQLRQILTELAERMHFEGIDAYSLYEDENKIPVTARDVLRKVYGYGFPYNLIDDKPVIQQPLLPAGMLPPNNRSDRNYGTEQTVCQ